MDKKNNYATHSFSVEMAKNIGLEETLILGHLYHWCLCNSDNQEMIKKDNIWVFISRTKILNIYPYLSEGKIKGVINRLKLQGYILIDCFNKSAIDKTNWYALTDKAYEMYGTSISKLLNKTDESPTLDNLTNDKLESPIISQNIQPIQYIEENYNNNIKEIKDKSFIKKVAKINWRGDYAIYKDEVYKARDLLLEDDDYKAKITKLYPNIDYHRSILKSVMYWESDKGWECKKKSQSNNIDMVATIKKNIDKSVVFQNKNNVPIENEKLLDMEIQDEDGNLGDGTFFKNGRRWYYSNKEKRVCSINIKASPRPSEEFEYDSVKDIWYIPKGTDRNPKLDSLLW